MSQLEGVAHYAEAMAWYRKAAEQGDAWGRERWPTYMRGAY
jgi:TPR repeat protein